MLAAAFSDSSSTGVYLLMCRKDTVIRNSNPAASTVQRWARFHTEIDGHGSASIATLLFERSRKRTKRRTAWWGMKKTETSKWSTFICSFEQIGLILCCFSICRRVIIVGPRYFIWLSSSTVWYSFRDGCRCTHRTDFSVRRLVQRIPCVATRIALYPPVCWLFRLGCVSLWFSDILHRAP